MEALALERTLREHPDDPAAWLVYGDLLLERGDPRGALIGLEHRLARARPADRAALQRQIDALVRKHQKRWSAALPPGVAAKAWRYGFVTKLAVPWSEDAPARIAQALREPLATALQISVKGRGGEGDDDDFDDDDEEDVNELPDPVDLAGLPALDLSQLVELDLSYAHLGAPGAEALAATASLGGLETLDLRYCKIGDAGLAALAAAPQLAGLRRLRLQRNELTGKGVAALARFERLVELDLRYNNLGTAGAKALLTAPFVGSLARLALNRTDVSAAGAKELARSPRLPRALRSFWRSV